MADKRPKQYAAEISLSSPEGEEIILGQDMAWIRSLELPRPVSAHFVQMKEVKDG